MAYIALYRKYRSQSFDELMGQESVTRTLQNAIATGRFGHAYLFFGARGCGKTSTARLLARALNCVHQDGPTPNPCGVCRLCVSIREGTCMDVVEMDAASETGIDDVREKIIENVQYAPTEARYKVYIIDEVHDLSAKAFDALLKTLEEPPAHVVFILATTEYHKVPITIRSRCQGFQFKRGTLHDLGAAVERVVRLEGFTADPEAIQAIARAAEGSWRDALSILEQVLAYSEGHVSAATVHRAIGTVGTETLAHVTATLASGDWTATLTAAAQLVDSGTDVRQLLTALQGHLRDLMLLSAGAKQAAAQELGADRLALLAPQATLFDPATILDMMGELASAEREIRITNQHRWLLERTLLRLMSIGQGVAAAYAPRRSLAPSAPAESAKAKNGTETEPLAATPAAVPRPTAPHSPHEDTPYTAPAEREDEAEIAERDDAVPVFAAPVVTPPATVVPVAANGPTAPEAAASEDNSHRFADDVSLEVIQRAWPRIYKLIEKSSPSGASYLKKAEVTGLQEKTIILSFTEAFARDRIQNKGRELVEKKLNEGLRTEGYRVQCVLHGQGGSGNNGSGGAGVPVVPPPDNGPPDMGMAALLDTPPTPAPAGGARSMMDFALPSSEDIQAAPDTRSSAPETTMPLAPTPGPAAPPAPPASSGLLAETLSIFGGEVIRSEVA